MPFVTVNGLKHHYMQQGDGADVVMIHGMGGNMSFWHANKALATLKNNFRVTVYDMRSHGYSEFAPDGFTSRQLALDLKELMDAVGIESAYIIGHSLGGLVALHTADLYPEKVKGLILTEGNIPALRKYIDLEKWPHRQQREDMLREINPKLPEILDGFNMYYLEYRLKEMGDEGNSGDLGDFGMRKGMKLKAKGVLKLLDKTSAKTDIRDIAGLTEERINNIETPTLALYGEFSPLMAICDYLSENVRNCSRVVVPEACHLFPARLPEKFVKNVQNYLFHLEKGDTFHDQRAAS